MRREHEHGDDHETDEAQSSGHGGVARVEEGLTHGDQPPDEDQHVEQEERLEDRRVDRPCCQPGDRGELDREERDDRQEDGRSHEPARETEAAIDGLARAGDDAGEPGRDEPADVARSGRRSDRRCGGSSIGRTNGGFEATSVRGHQLRVRWGRASRQHATKRGDAGRSISLPEIARRLVL
jgi:hypothetical protein